MSRRGPDRRPRLAPGQVRCDGCHQALPKGAAATINGKVVHPIGCFDVALEAYVKVVDDRLRKNLGGIDLSVSIDSMTPRTAAHLGSLARRVLDARRAAR